MLCSRRAYKRWRDACLNYYNIQMLQAIQTTATRNRLFPPCEMILLSKQNNCEINSGSDDLDNNEKERLPGCVGLHLFPSQLTALRLGQLICGAAVFLCFICSWKCPSVTSSRYVSSLKIKHLKMVLRTLLLCTQKMNWQLLAAAQCNDHSQRSKYNEATAYSFAE